MGLCLGTEVTEEEKRARIHSAKIDRDLYEFAKRDMNLVKVLLLGAAESGKSTLVKQMKIIHSNGFTKQELTSFKPAVLDNLLTSMKFVLHGMGVLRINLANSRNKIHAHSVLSCGRCFDEDQVLFPFLSHALSCLLTDQGVRAAAARGYEYELNDSALYFFENMTRITSPDYVPTETDVLRVRLRTTGVIETQFKVSHLIFRMYDVGGQRTERRKWISCFEDVRAVLFVVSLSGYDMTLVEDPSMNRLQESMKLFSSICNNVFFRSTSMAQTATWIRPPASSPPPLFRSTPWPASSSTTTSPRRRTPPTSRSSFRWSWTQLSKRTWRQCHFCDRQRTSLDSRPCSCLDVSF
ncbi:guanine nucleotide binding protein (G protein) alpha v1 isoform X2 [Hippoglossus stenolepis]|uniref:guanine nucleotide binding protein (G protein) alpha v1 isoform X2 n=1 Tax=Hippoglossus stenolepis TaxID=195615 RepID=UPI00159C6D1F|nr:guanine nucleotide binding protein (G protein) alpha v1 isoform X2 [Hippoglossus stenolepis]